MRTSMRLAAAGAAGAMLLAGTACGATTNSDKTSAKSSSGVSVSKGFKVGLLLPESKTARYEAFDRPLVTKKLKSLCSACQVLYQNADQETSKQQSQAESMLTQGVKVLILDAVDAKAAGGIVAEAHKQNVPVVAYDRLATGPVSYYVSFNNKKVGQVQGKALLAALKTGGSPKRGKVVMINGSPTDPNAADFKAGAHSVLDGKITIGKEYDTPDWSPDKAQNEMQQAITALGKKKIIGVYAANDGTAGGAIAAMKDAGFTDMPPVTGQDAELAGIQRIVAGQQYMTVYKAIKPEADIAGTMAIDAATGKKYGDPRVTQVTSGSNTVPSVLLNPVAVTKKNIKSTVIADGFYTAKQICTKQFKSACKKLGIS